jgi:hypothetical protein
MRTYALRPFLLLLLLGIALDFASAQSKEVRVEYFHIRPKIASTWDEMLRSSDAVVEVTAQDASGGEARYYGPADASVVTANTAVVTHVYYRGKGVSVEDGATVLILTPGGRIDRGEYIQHVVVPGAEPWRPGRTYIVAMVWRAELKAWQPTGYYESVFAIDDDGKLQAMGKQEIAKEANALGRAAFVQKIRATARSLATSPQ